MPGDELHQVAPVHPDVTEGARGTAECGVDPPVGLRRPRPASPAGRSRAAATADRPRRRAIRCPDLADGRVEPVDERDGGHHPARAADLINQLGLRLPRLVASGFSQTTALPAASAGSASSACVRVRGADVHDVDVGASRSAPRPKRAGGRRAEPVGGGRRGAGVDPATRLDHGAPPPGPPRACTPPMKPVPMIPAQRSTGSTGVPDRHPSPTSSGPARRRG